MAGSRVEAAVTEDIAPTGVLRASINLGNPVLAHGTPESPSGVAVEIARELAARLDVPLQLFCVDAARKSFDAISTGQADICFLAIEPARQAEVAFTAPYVVIEGVFAVRKSSSIETIADVDRGGVRVGVKNGSAYDLFLSRTLEHAAVVRGDEGVDTFLQLGLDVAAGIRQPLAAFVGASRSCERGTVPGIRQPLAAFVESHSDLRLLDGRFMEIRQALGTTRTRAAETIRFLHAFIEELKAGGLIADALQRANQSASVAPPEPAE